MNIQDIGALGSSAGKAGAQSSASKPTAADKNNDAVQQFIDYMSESPMQRMIDAWLKAHHLTEKDLESMPPEKRDAILKQMTADIKNEMKQKVEANYAG